MNTNNQCFYSYETLTQKMTGKERKRSISRNHEHVLSRRITYSRLGQRIYAHVGKSFNSYPQHGRHDNDTLVEAHYHRYTLDKPITTLKFPVWKYHLTNLNNDAVEDFDVDYSRLSIEKDYIDICLIHTKIN